jgi:hypothetical protein
VRLIENQKWIEDTFVRCWIDRVGVTSYVLIDCSLCSCRVSLAYFDVSMMSDLSLSIFDRLVVSVKVLLSYNKQVATWPLKTCIEVLTVKDLVRTMSELCQSDRQWILCMFLPSNQTFETSPLWMLTDPSMMEVASLYNCSSQVATRSLLISIFILSMTLSDTSFTIRRYKLVYQRES